jgi:hypothetical protein
MKIFAKIYFRFRKNFLTKIDKNSGNFHESFQKNAISVIFTTYFNYMYVMFAYVLFLPWFSFKGNENQ